MNNNKKIIKKKRLYNNVGRGSISNSNSSVKVLVSIRCLIFQFSLLFYSPTFRCFSAEKPSL